MEWLEEFSDKLAKRFRDGAEIKIKTGFFSTLRLKIETRTYYRKYQRKQYFFKKELCFLDKYKDLKSFKYASRDIRKKICENMQKIVDAFEEEEKEHQKILIQKETGRKNRERKQKEQKRKEAEENRICRAKLEGVKI